MSGDHEERIIDACLEEVLGGHYPPDLTAKILQTLEARINSPRTASIGEKADSSPLVPQSALSAPPPPPVQAAVTPPPPPVQADSLVRVTSDSRQRRRKKNRYTALAVAASILAVALLAGLYGSRAYLGQPPGNDLAQSSSNDLDRALAVQTEEAIAGGDGEPRVIPVGTREDRILPPVPSVVVAPPAVDPSTSTVAVPADSSGGDPPTWRQLRQPSTDGDILAFVNDVLRDAWQENSVTASPPATDEQWCKRAYQRLVGREPSSDELNRFERDREAGKRERLVDQLLASDAYARHFAELWSDVLVDPRQHQKRNNPSDREELVEYLEDSLRDDKSYDQLVYELIAAQGSGDPDSDDYNGAVNFLLAGAGRDASADTDRTARAFLGKQLVCTRCHSHPASGWEQGDFWELNAFFRQMKVRWDAQRETARLVDEDFYGESGAAKDAEIFYQLPNGRLEVAYPTLGEREISRSGLVVDVNRRRELAKLLTGSVDFRRALTNRIWSWLMGYGFTQPVDDMGPHNPPSHPELLDRLAEELAAHDFHPDSLVRWIVLSEAFGLSDKQMPESWLDSPETGGRPLFARWYTDEDDDQPEDVYHALVRAVHTRTTDELPTRGTLARRTFLRPGVVPLKIIQTQPDAHFPGPTWLPRLAASPMRPEQKIEHVFLSVLGRNPTAPEMKAAKLVLADRLDDRAAIQKVWQTLLTSDASEAEIAAR